MEFIIGFGSIAIYFIVLAFIALLLRKIIKIPDEIFRKILHFILLGSSIIWLFIFKTWWKAAISCLLFAIVVYPILMLFEKIKSYSNVVTERKKGELKSSLLIVFFMFALIISLCWGYLNDKMLALASIYAWGIGDAFAALIGKKIGKHKIYKSKSIEGTFSMFIFSFLSILSILIIRGLTPWYGCIIASFVVATIVSIVELFTPNGLDTLTCPISAMITLVPLIYLFGGLI